MVSCAAVSAKLFRLCLAEVRTCFSHIIAAQDRDLLISCARGRSLAWPSPTASVRASRLRQPFWLYEVAAEAWEIEIRLRRFAHFCCSFNRCEATYSRSQSIKLSWLRALRLSRVGQTDPFGPIYVNVLLEVSARMGVDLIHCVKTLYTWTGWWTCALCWGLSTQWGAVKETCFAHGRIKWSTGSALTDLLKPFVLIKIAMASR